MNSILAGLSLDILRGIEYWIVKVLTNSPLKLPFFLGWNRKQNVSLVVRCEMTRFSKMLCSVFGIIYQNCEVAMDMVAKPQQHSIFPLFIQYTENTSNSFHHLMILGRWCTRVAMTLVPGQGRNVILFLSWFLYDKRIENRSSWFMWDVER